MSFVSVIGSEDFITVVSDGLVKDTTTGKELDQRYQKFNRISDNQFVAFAGNQGVADALKEAIPFINKPRDLISTSEIIHNRLLEVIPVEKARMSVVIGGVSPSGNIEFHSFTNDVGQKIKSYYPTSDGVLCSFLQSSEISELDLSPIFINFLGETGLNTSNKVLKAQKKLNNYVAERDSTVNKVTFELVIKKS